MVRNSERREVCLAITVGGTIRYWSCTAVGYRWSAPPVAMTDRPHRTVIVKAPLRNSYS